MSSSKNDASALADEPDVKESRTQLLRKRLGTIDTALQLLQDSNAARGATPVGQAAPRQSHGSSAAGLGEGGAGVAGRSREAASPSAEEALHAPTSAPAAMGPKKGGKWAARDESFTINSSLPQRTSCERCGLEMAVSALRRHLDFDCAEKSSCCPEVGCGLVMALSQLNRHIAKECSVARKRRKLVRQQRVRQTQRQAEEAARIEQLRAKPGRPPVHSPENEEVCGQPLALPGAEEGADGERERAPTHDPNATALSTSSDRFMICCEDCQESMKRSQYYRHRSRQCKFRPVACPNSAVGCAAEVPFAKLLDHLFYDCVAERRKDALVERAKERCEVITCAACGEQMMLLQLRAHEATTCANRFVKCKNAALGCNAVLRNHERAFHEKVDLKRSMKTCLYFEGDGAHLAIREDDVPPPWTVELWLLRPPPEESLRCYLRQLSRHVYAFAASFDAERELCERSVATTQYLRGKEAAAMDAERRKAMVADLSGNIKLYEVYALRTSAAAQLIELCLQGMASLLAELTAPGGGDPALTHQLSPLPDPPGWQELESYEAAEAARVGSAQGSRGASRGGAQEDDSSVSIKDVDFAAVDRNRGVLSGLARKAHELSKQQMRKLAKLSPLCALYLLGLALDEALLGAFESRYAVICGISHKNSAWKEVCASIGEALAADQQLLVRWREDAGLVSTIKEAPAIKGKARAKAKDADPKKEEREKARARREQAKSREKVARAHTPGSAPEAGRLTDRMAAAAKIVSGFETILASTTTDAEGNSCRICLDVGGRVGLVTTNGPAGGSAVLDFGPAAAVPRGRWVHVALTCAPRPNRTVLYIDGAPAGSLKGAAMPLPMGSLGGQAGRPSFNGALLDARYWRKVRSRVEIARGKNRLIDMTEHYRQKAAPANPSSRAAKKAKSAAAPKQQALQGTAEAPAEEPAEAPTEEEPAEEPTEEELPRKAEGRIVDLSADRLLLWYPLEEQLGAERVYDATEYRFKTLVKRAETLTPQQLEQQPKESKEQREERRLLSGFKWLYAELVPQPALPRSSDGGEGEREKMRNICQFEVKRIRMAAAGRLLQGDVDCPQGCDERVRALDLRFHTTYSCSMRSVQCRFAHMGCAASFASASQQEHEERHCRVVVDRRRMQLSADEKNRLVPCDLCSEQVKLKHLVSHASDSCAFRAVRCPHADCAEELQAHSLPEHLQFRCRSAGITLRAFRVERARERSHYPRPWGIVVEAGAGV